jgi:hypothetical protein
MVLMSSTPDAHWRLTVLELVPDLRQMLAGMLVREGLHARSLCKLQNTVRPTIYAKKGARPPPLSTTAE